MSLLRLAGISRLFGSLVALNDIDLEVEEGELYAVIGPNGAGKTTLFNLISGFFPATSGDIRFDGRQINRVPAPDRVTLGLVRTFQITEVFPELSVYENIRIGVEAQANISARPWPGFTSGRRVNAAVEELLLLDEPTAGMGEDETDHMMALIRDLHDRQGLTILFIEHDMDLVFGLAERITVLNYGKVLATGTPREVADNPLVQAAYLGERG